MGASILNRPNSMVWGILKPKEDSLGSFDGLLIGRALVNAGTKNIPARLLKTSLTSPNESSQAHRLPHAVLLSVVAEMCCACEGSKKNSASDDSEMHCACECRVKTRCVCDDGEKCCAREGSKKKNVHL